MKVFMKIYLVLLIGLGMYAVGYIFGEWLATRQIDVSYLKILKPFVLGLPALLLATRGKKKGVEGI